MPKKKVRVLLAKIDDACLHPASLGRRVYLVRSGCLRKSQQGRQQKDKVGSTYVNQESRCDPEATINPVHHCPAKTSGADRGSRCECLNSNASTIVNTPSKDPDAGKWTDNRLGLEGQVVSLGPFGFCVVYSQQRET